MRKERPLPGAQLELHNTTSDGRRLTAFLTDTPDGPILGQVAGLELRHRRHARVEDRIKAGKQTGMANFQLKAYRHNKAWLETVMCATSLPSPGLPQKRSATKSCTWPPKSPGVRGYVNLKLDQTWAWAAAVADG